MSEPFGLLNVLKPPGMSSHDVVGAVRRLVGTRRVGHGGTLDPAAAGVMTVAVGKATRLLGYLRDDKAYRAVVRFGLATDSGDAEGQVTARADASGLTADALLNAMQAFRGEITQRPPMTSAVHVDGIGPAEVDRALRRGVHQQRIVQRHHAEVEGASRVRQRLLRLQHHRELRQIEAADVHQRARALIGRNRLGMSESVADLAQRHKLERRRQIELVR